MKKIIFTLSFLLIASFCQSQEPTTFVLVRHAEKAKDGTADPPLNEAGKKRALRLAEMFGLQEIGGLYTTPYQRTQETLQPLAETKNLVIAEYKPLPGEDWLKYVLKEHAGQTVIVSGHSNTIPVLANMLLGKEIFTQFDEQDYSNLIIIVAEEVGNGKLVRLRF